MLISTFPIEVFPDAVAVTPLDYVSSPFACAKLCIRIRNSKGNVSERQTLRKRGACLYRERNHYGISNPRKKWD